MIPVVTPERMAAVDAAAGRADELIERAGAAVSRVALNMLGGAYGRIVAVIAGPGNNGADGRAAARRLAAQGARVIVHDHDDCPTAINRADLVIDAAFGTGFRGDWTPPSVGTAMVLAVDVPTGLEALTGRKRPETLRADTTVTFQAAKPGHVLGDGPDVCGEVVVVDIGLDLDGPGVNPSPIGVVTGTDVAHWLPQRSRTDHKWNAAVRVVGGSRGMAGAPYLAAAAAQRAGAGLVSLSSPGVEARCPLEVVEVPFAQAEWASELLFDLYRYHALVIGPGLGRAEGTPAQVVAAVMGALVPVVVDGDGLFALSWNTSGTANFLIEREVPTVLTPHDGEFAMIAGGRPGTDRIGAARHLAEATGATVLLKGATTIVADPAGPTYLVDNGDQRLATAGSGDVLAGVVGALLARGMPAPLAAAAGAWLHAEAGNQLPAHGLIASDLIGGLRPAFARVDSARAPEVPR